MKRILFSTKHIFVVMVIIMLTIFLSLPIDNPLEVKQEETNSRDYNTFYQNMKESSETMLSVSIHAEKNSFSYRNICKTLKDYEDIRDWKVTKKDVSLEEAFFDSEACSYLMFFYVLFMITAFDDTKRSGMKKIIHATKGGRKRLVIKRICILSIVIAVVTFLIYAIRLFLLQVQYGRIMQYDIPIQTVKRFFYIPHCYTVGGFLIRLFITKVLFMVIFGCLIWLLQLTIKHFILTSGVLVCGFAVEFVLQRWLADSSSLVFFKYVNILHLIEPTGLYETYLNLNIFGYPVNIIRLNQMILLVLVVISILGILYQGEHGYPVVPAGVVEKLIEKVKDPFLHLLHKMRYVGLESYKILFAQRGIWALILLFFLLSSYEGVSIHFLSMEDVYADRYYQEWGGKVSEETLVNLNTLLQEQQELATDETYNIHHLNGLQQVYDTATYLYDNAEKTGKECILISPFAYESVLGKESKAYHLLQTAKIIAVIVILSASIIPYEKEWKMQYLIHTTKVGKRRFFKYKILIGLFWVVAVTIIFYGKELLSAANVLSGFSYLNASAGNLLFLSDAVHCSILMLLIVTYLTKIGFCILIYFLNIVISSQITRSKNSLMLLLVLLEVPIMVAYFFAGIF